MMYFFCDKMFYLLNVQKYKATNRTKNKSVQFVAFKVL